MDSSASAQWQGSLKEGNGVITTASQILTDVPYTFATRFEGKKGTNPEELIAAAHAACFSMAFSAELGKLSLTPERVETAAVVTLAAKDGGFSVTHSRLTCAVVAPGGDRKAVEEAAAAAKVHCPISKLLNAEISLTLQVEV